MSYIAYNRTMSCTRDRAISSVITAAFSVFGPQRLHSHHRLSVANVFCIHLHTRYCVCRSSVSLLFILRIVVCHRQNREDSQNRREAGAVTQQIYVQGPRHYSMLYISNLQENRSWDPRKRLPCVLKLHKMPWRPESRLRAFEGA